MISVRSNYSVTSSKSGKPGGGIQTSLKKGIPKASRFASSKKLDNPEEEESIWKGIFNNRDIFDYIRLQKILKGNPLDDIDELKNLPGGNIWRLPSSHTIGNGKTNIGALRSQVLANYFKGAENVPEEVLKEVFPQENDRNKFLTEYHSKTEKMQKELQLHESFDSSILSRRDTMEDNKDEINEKPGRLNRKSLFAKNDDGEQDDAHGEGGGAGGKKARRKVTIENSRGELEEISADEWPTFEQFSEELSLRGSHSDFPESIGRKTSEG